MAGRALSPDDQAEKDACLAAIAEHLDRHGPNNWKLVQEKFPNVQERKFFRWVTYVQECKNLPNRMDTARLKAKRISNQLGAAIPAPVPPSAVARLGAEPVRQKLDFLVEVDDIRADVIFLRNKSLRYDAEGKAVDIKNSNNFIHAIQKRIDLMETVLKLKAEIWDYERMEDFYNEITSILTEECAPYPALQRKITERLHALNERRGVKF